MIQSSARGILLDIEGTTSSISFVYDVMFPFVRRQLEFYLQEHWGTADLSQACARIAQDAGHESLEAWSNYDSSAEQKLVIEEVIRLMDQDVKATGLKQLQGLVWEHGFSRGELVSHVYEDVPPALERWRAAGVTIRIYSSGSVHAQKLFFGHTAYGNLLPYFSGYDDTTTGAKKDAESYRRIASAFGCSPRELLFLSDITAELDAAREAGFQTAQVVRDGDSHAEEFINAVNSKAEIVHPIVESFDPIQLSQTAVPLSPRRVRITPNPANPNEGED